MKNFSYFFFFTIVALCALPAFAQKESFGHLGLFYATPSADLSGGGLVGGGEYINGKTHWGIGARGLLGWQAGHEKKRIYRYLAESGYGESQCDMIDAVLGLDLYVPARLFDWLTLYAGGGVAFHTLKVQFDDFAYTCQTEFPKDCTTESLFLGGRWHVSESFFLFGEYRRDFGEVTIVHDYTWNGKDKKAKHTYDMDGNRFLIGLGLSF